MIIPRAMGMRQVFGILCLGLPLVRAPVAAAQNTNESVEFLVARSGLQDRFFKESVVLLLPSTDLPLVVGMIVNKPSTIRLHTIFPENPALKDDDARAYFGGPVDVTSASLVLRQAEASKGALHLSGDIYVSFDPELISHAYAGAHPASNQRLFFGRSQWAPDQLQNEMFRGAWYRLRTRGDCVFSRDPAGVWPAMLKLARPTLVVESMGRIP